MNRLPQEVINEFEYQPGIGLVFLAKEILFDLYPEICEEQNIKYKDIKEVFASYQPFEEDPFYWEIFIRMEESNKDIYWGDSLTSEAIKDYIYDKKSMETFELLNSTDNETLKGIVRYGNYLQDNLNILDNLPEDYWHDTDYDILLDPDGEGNN